MFEIDAFPECWDSPSQPRVNGDTPDFPPWTPGVVEHFRPCN